MHEPSEAILLQEATDWLAGQSLDAPALRRLAQERGLDFATAVLYQSVRQSPRHGSLICAARKIRAAEGRRWTPRS